jgi:hypothetical protein
MREIKERSDSRSAGGKLDEISARKGFLHPRRGLRFQILP